MALPAVGEVALELWEQAFPEAVRDQDTDHDYGLLKLGDAAATPLLERAHTYAADREDQEGWVITLDPENAPAELLPWQAQFVGVRLEPSLSEAEQRLKIALPEGFRRGSTEAIVAAVKRTLTGSQHVYIEERVGGSAYAMAIRTLTSETPVPTVVPRNVRRGLTDLTPTEAAIVSQKPIGNVCSYQTIDGATFAEIEAEYTDIADLEANNPTFADIPVLPD